MMRWTALQLYVVLTSFLIHSVIGQSQANDELSTSQTDDGNSKFMRTPEDDVVADPLNADGGGDRLDDGKRVKRMSRTEQVFGTVPRDCSYEREMMKRKRIKRSARILVQCGTVTKRTYKLKGYGSLSECEERERLAWNYDQWATMEESRERVPPPPPPPVDDECVEREKLAYNYDQFASNSRSEENLGWQDWRPPTWIRQEDSREFASRSLSQEADYPPIPDVFTASNNQMAQHGGQAGWAHGGQQGGHAGWAQGNHVGWGAHGQQQGSSVEWAQLDTSYEKRPPRYESLEQDSTFDNSQPPADSTFDDNQSISHSIFNERRPTVDMILDRERRPTADSTFVNRRPTADSTFDDSRPTADSTFVDLRPTADSTFVNSRPTAESTFDDSRPTADLTFVDLRPTADSTFDDSRPTADLTFDDSRQTVDSTFDDRRPTVDSTFDDSRPTADSTFDDRQPTVERMNDKEMEGPGLPADYFADKQLLDSPETKFFKDKIRLRTMLGAFQV